MKRTVYECTCGAVRQEANHWFLASLTYAAEFTEKVLVVSRWDDEDAKQPDAIHLCGEACVLKAVSQFMAKPAPPQEVAE